MHETTLIKHESCAVCRHMGASHASMLGLCPFCGPSASKSRLNCSPLSALRHARTTAQKVQVYDDLGAVQGKVRGHNPAKLGLTVGPPPHQS